MTLAGQPATEAAVPGTRRRPGDPGQTPSALPALGVAAAHDGSNSAPVENGARKAGGRLDATAPVLLRIVTPEGSVYRRPLARDARNVALEVALDAGGDGPVEVFRVQTDDVGVPVGERKTFDCDPGGISVQPLTFEWPALRRYTDQLGRTLRLLAELDDVDPDEIAALAELLEELLGARRDALAGVFSDHPATG